MSPLPCHWRQSLLLLLQVNSIKISEDSSPLDLVRRILDSASEVHLALLRTVGWSEMPSCRAHLPRPTINAYDTSDEESCTGRRPSRLRLSPTPTRQRSPSGCVTETASFGKALHTGRHGQQLLLFPPHEPQRSISAPSSPRNKSTVHLTPYRRNMHCFHSDHSDEDSSDSCPMGSPIRHVFASRPRLNSHSYVNCHFPIQSQNGSIRQPAAVEQGTTCVCSADWLLGALNVIIAFHLHALCGLCAMLERFRLSIGLCMKYQ